MSGHTAPGDAAAGIGRDRFDRMYGAYYRPVLAYCLRRAGRHDAADAVAETFAVAWRRIADVPPEPATLPWLYAVAYRVLGHRHRSLRRQRRLLERMRGDVTAAAGPEPRLVRSEEYEQVVAALGRLRRLDQEVLRLAHWEELSHDEVARVLDITPTAARQRLSRAQRRLARVFARIGGMEPGGPA